MREERGSQTITKKKTAHEGNWTLDLFFTKEVLYH